MVIDRENVDGDGFCERCVVADDDEVLVAGLRRRFREIVAASYDHEFGTERINDHHFGMDDRVSASGAMNLGVWQEHGPP